MSENEKSMGFLNNWPHGHVLGSEIGLSSEFEEVGSSLIFILLLST